MRATFKPITLYLNLLIIYLYVQITHEAESECTDVDISVATIINSQTPNLPSLEPNKTETQCWTISSPNRNRIIQLTVDLLNLTDDCSSNYLKIFDGSTQNSKLLFFECGYLKVKPEIDTSSPFAFLQFKYSATHEDYGFKIILSSKVDPDEEDAAMFVRTTLSTLITIIISVSIFVLVTLVIRGHIRKAASRARSRVVRLNAASFYGRHERRERRPRADGRAVGAEDEGDGRLEYTSIRHPDTSARVRNMQVLSADELMRDDRRRFQPGSFGDIEMPDFSGGAPPSYVQISRLDKQWSEPPTYHSLSDQVKQAPAYYSPNDQGKRADAQPSSSTELDLPSAELSNPPPSWSTELDLPCSELPSPPTYSAALAQPSDATTKL